MMLASLAAAAFVALACQVDSAQAWTSSDVTTVRAAADAQEQCVIDHEVGGVGYSPNVRGAHGERGAYQLGAALAAEMEARLGEPAENPYAAHVYFLELRAEGRLGNWPEIARHEC